MTIIYLCPPCSKIMHAVGFHATNEVGRKYCERCDSNKNNLVVINKQSYEKLIREAE